MSYRPFLNLNSHYSTQWLLSPSALPQYKTGGRSHLFLSVLWCDNHKARVLACSWFCSYSIQCNFCAKDVLVFVLNIHYHISHMHSHNKAIGATTSVWWCDTRINQVSKCKRLKMHLFLIERLHVVGWWILTWPPGKSIVCSHHFWHLAGLRSHQKQS